ncbi:MAG: ATP-binding protein [Desulfosarcinaceae bacterium]
MRRQTLERRRAEFQLQQNQKMRAIGTLAGGIAHDFNNILAAILGYTELAMMDIDADIIKVKGWDRRLTPDLLPGHYLELTVNDTGVGIASEVLDRVFDPYFTTQSHKNSAGLGLSVVHGIVHRQGGSIDIDSTIGQGTTVKVRLPVAGTQKAPSIISTGQVKGGREHILFVDDEQALAQIGQQMLQRLGDTVTCRTSSVEALDSPSP